MNSKDFDPSSVKVDTGVPIPAHSGGWDGPRYHFLYTMQVGDSVELPKGIRPGINGSIYYIEKRYNKKFTARTINDEYFRVWRVE